MSIQNSHRIEDVKIMLKMGVNGKGISSIEKTSTVGLVDTYTITYDDGSKSTYDVTNGRGIVSIVKTGTTGLVDSYRITYNDGSVFNYTVTNAKSIVNISKTETEGFVDTYTITFNDGTSTTYDVVNGSMGVWTSAVTGAVGATSVTISSADIETTSVIDIYCQNNSGKSITIKEVTLSNGQAVLTFNPLTEATDFMIHIINAIGESVNENEVITRSILTAHNLLPNTAKTTSVNGVTFTVNNDKSVTVSTGAGGATQQTSFVLFEDVASWKNMVMTGTPAGASGTTYDLYAYDTVTSGENSLRGDSSVVLSNITNGNKIRVAIRIRSGVIITTPITFYPMIRLATDADTTYRPYAMTNKQLTDNKVGWDDNALLGSHNLLPNNIASGTYNSGTVTKNTDGSLTINGTFSAVTTINMDYKTGLSDAVFDVLPFVGKNLVASILETAVTGITLQVGYFNSGGTRTSIEAVSTKSNIVFPSGAVKSATYLRIANGAYNNVTIYPMIRLASDSDSTYQPYAKTNKQLTDNVTDIETAIAPIEIGTASQAYAKGDYLIMNDKLYKATTAIVSGATLTIGTNIVQTSVAEELEKIQVQILIASTISTYSDMVFDLVRQISSLIAEGETIHGFVNWSGHNIYSFVATKTTSVQYKLMLTSGDYLFSAVCNDVQAYVYRYTGTAV